MPRISIAGARAPRSAGPLLGFVLALVVFAGGCAPATGWQFADEPGVPVSMSLRNQGTASGSLIAYEDGVFVLETTYERGENVEVLRVDGEDHVYVSDVVVGRAAEIRDFDIVTRRPISPTDVTGLDVKTRAYAGWGSVIAGVLAFFLVLVAEDV